jgi:hypothetical protein
MAIFWVLRSGAPWRDLPETCELRATSHNRLYPDPVRLVAAVSLALLSVAALIFRKVALHRADRLGMMQPRRIRSSNQEVSMLGRIVAVTLALGVPMTSSAAFAQSDPVAGAVAGAIVGAAIATGAVVPYEHREPLHEYIVREHRPSYRYEEEVVVGRELPPGPYESYPVPEQYGVPDHHYVIVNDRPVIFHPQTRRIIHVYD